MQALSRMPTLRTRLRQATEACHREVEARLDVVGPGLSRSRYRAVLRLLYGFYAPLEPRLETLARVAALDVPLTDRTGLLARDLVALGTPPGELVWLPRCRLPVIDGVGGLAGALYVVEGACLGGQVVAPVLERRLGLTAERGAAFFTGRGAGTSARWRWFLRWLDDSVASGACESTIVDAAELTFRALARWTTNLEGGDG